MHAVLALLFAMTPAPAQEGPGDATSLPAFEEFLVIGNVASRGRRADHTDAIEKQIVRGAFSPPKAGDEVRCPDGDTAAWSSVMAGDKGDIEHADLRGGYAYASVDASEAGPAILDARGHSVVYVNGVPRAGDPYSLGTLRLPIDLVEGTNEFLFRVGRGRLQATLLDVPRNDDGTVQPLAFMMVDDTVPDLVTNTPVDALGGLVVANFTDDWTPSATISAVGPDGMQTTSFISSIPPMSMRKIPVRLRTTAPTEKGKVAFTIDILEPESEDPVDRRTLELRVRGPEDTRRVTFRSDIDGSVQYYGLTPADWDLARIGRPGIIMSLHGAGVEAQRQAGCYSPKSFAHVVAPTNRRRFGFDWEDWGRLDAMEALQHAKKSLNTDPQRQWLTGHSMGGHGTWQIGAHKPHLFAAIAPSAGWVSFESYTGSGTAPTDDIGLLLERTASPSDTLALKRNFDRLGVYVLHGDADDNVPVREARSMREALRDHADLTYHEQEGAGHWWGNQCVDWPALIEFLDARTLPVEPVPYVDFTTISPGISGRSGGIEITNQRTSFLPSRVIVRRDTDAQRLEIDTENVTRIRLQSGLQDRFWTFVIDGQEIDLSLEQRERIEYGLPSFWLRNGRWESMVGSSPNHKHPLRYGPFKSAFTNNMLFVVGTSGTDEETEINTAKAVFDAETFLYRGNGSVEVLPDVEFKPEHHERRNVILYGNADNNSAWATLLPKARLHVDRGGVSIGNQRIDGEDLAVLAIQPNYTFTNTLVGIVAGTGPQGMRLTEQLPYFVSGVHYPDVTVFAPEMLDHGEVGIQAVGFFGMDWSVENGEFVYRTPPDTAAVEELAPGQKRARGRIGRPVPRRR
ncbi:MAG: prolyl oligopeptidase family serine peptidase [Phycisphaerales bacterium]|nr:prolyl oligopeptidase family serine peptidase [Phycisphaerales bacterium]